MRTSGIGQIGPNGLGSAAFSLDLVDDRARFGGVTAVMNENLLPSLGECDGGGTSDATRGAP